MTPEEEAEHYKYLKLKEKQAMGSQGQTSQTSTETQTFPDALKASFQQLTAPLISAAEKLHPKNLTALLPAAGATAGTAVLPGAGTAAGAGLGSIAQKMANMVYGTSGPVEPTTSIMGIPIAPKAAIDPMLNTALAGAPETQEGQAATQAISDAYQSAKPGFKKGISKFFGMTTGKGPVKVLRQINDPTSILPESLGGSKSVSDASDAYGQALNNDKTLIPQEDGSFKKGLQKTAFGPFKRGHQEAEDVAQSIYDKWQNGENINAQEAYDAKRATDKLWPAVVKERNAEDIKQMSEFKTVMDDILSSQSGDFSKASKDYARARLGADFTQVLPRTKTGDISTVKTLLMPLLEPRKIPFMLGTSPAVFGAGNLAAQATMKGLNVLSSDPTIRQTLLGILQQLMAKKKT